MRLQVVFAVVSFGSLVLTINVVLLVRVLNNKALPLSSA